MENLEGRIEEHRLADVFLQISRGRATGILTIQGEQEIIGLSFLAGELVSADALNQSLEDGLGRILVARELVSPDVLANLSAEHHAGGGRVVDLLLERNYVPRKALTESLREHTYGLCLQVMRWPQGEFKFYRGDEVSFEEGVKPLPVDELFVRAAEQLGSSSILGGKVPAPDSVFERVDRLDDSLTAETLGELLAPGLATADPGEQIESLLDRVDGSRSVSDLAFDTGLDEYRVRLSLLRMEQADLVQRKRGLRAEPNGRRAFGVTQRAKATPPPEPAPPPLSAPRPPQPPPPAPPPVAPAPAPPRPAPPPRAVPKGEPQMPPVWAARSLAAGLLLAVALYCGASPWRLLLPFPWNDGLRGALDRERQAVVFLQVDRAARTFFLLEGRFPESLEELTQGRLLPAAAAAPGLTYAATASSFRLQAPSGATYSDGISGNFLLDPEFQAPTVREEPPLVLLD